MWDALDAALAPATAARTRAATARGPGIGDWRIFLFGKKISLFSRSGGDKSAKDFAAQVQANPGDVRARIKLADLYARQGETLLAVDQYLEAARAYAKGGFTLKAIAVFRSASRIAPEDEGILRELISLYRKEGLLGEAAEVYAALADLYKRAGDPHPLIKMAQQFRSAGAVRREVILKAYDIACADRPDAQRFADLMAFVDEVRRAAAPAEAAAFIEGLRQVYPARFEPLEQRALLLDQAGDREALRGVLQELRRHYVEAHVLEEKEEFLAGFEGKPKPEAPPPPAAFDFSGESVTPDPAAARAKDEGSASDPALAARMAAILGASDEEEEVEAAAIGGESGDEGDEAGIEAAPRVPTVVIEEDDSDGGSLIERVSDLYDAEPAVAPIAGAPMEIERADADETAQAASGTPPPARRDKQGAVGRAPAAPPQRPAARPASAAQRDESDDEGEEEEARASRDPSLRRIVMDPVWPEGRADHAVKSAEDELKEFESMLSDFRVGVGKQVGEADYETHYNLGIAYKEMGLIEDAVGEFKKCVDLGQRKVDSLLMLAACMTEAFDHAQAIAYYRRALESEGCSEAQRLGIRYELGLAYEARDERKEALACFKEVYAEDASYRQVREKVVDLDR